MSNRKYNMRAGVRVRDFPRCPMHNLRVSGFACVLGHVDDQFNAIYNIASTAQSEKMHSWLARMANIVRQSEIANVWCVLIVGVCE